MLTDARQVLPKELPISAEQYQTMLNETVDLAPQDLNLAWRVLVKGLNRFDQEQRIKIETTALSPGAAQNRKLFKDHIYPWFIHPRAIEDESFIRACVEDVESPEYRARLRLGMIGAFLARYSDALKKPPAKLPGTVTTEKN